MTRPYVELENPLPPMDSPDVLVMYVVYYSPTDYPGLFVVRRHETRRAGAGMVEVPTTEHWTASSLEEARARIPEKHGTLVPRFEADFANVLEVWI